MFEKISLIMKGSRSVIYSAIIKQTQQPVAIKMPLENADPTILKLIDREIFLLKKLSHQNILSLITADPTEHSFVTELMDGDLFGLIDRMDEESLPLKERWRIVRNLLLPVSEALTYMHQNKYIHRDIKPENVFFRYSNSDPLSFDVEVKIGDLEHGAMITGQSGRVRSKHLRGTAQYLAPESAKNKLYSRESDVYSFGLLVYAMTTLNLPYQGIKPTQIINFILPYLHDEIDISNFTVADREHIEAEHGEFSDFSWTFLCSYQLSPFWVDEMPPDLDSLAKNCCQICPKNRITMATARETLMTEIARNTELTAAKEDSETSSTELHVSAKALIESTHGFLNPSTPQTKSTEPLRPLRCNAASW